MKVRTHYLAGACGAGLVWASMAVGAHAQEASDNGSQADAAADAEARAQGIGDIVVTAQRREQNLQDVPVAVTAVSQEGLVNAGISNSLDIGKMVPSMKIKSLGGRPNLFIRGVGLNDFSYNAISPIAIYRDEMVVSSPGAQAFPIFDLSQMEVLRGPQGTLFGKNTTGGAVLFNSQLPGDEFDGYVKFDYGRYDLVQLEAGVTLPISDTLSVRMSGYSERRNGDNLNLFTGKRVGEIDRTAARAIIRYRPTPDFQALLTLGYSRDTGDYRIAKPVGILPGDVNLLGYKDPAPNDPHILNYDFDGIKNIEDRYAILNLSYDVGDFTFKSISGYDRSFAMNQCDCDASPGQLDTHRPGPVRAKEISQEFQLNYSGNGHNALLGLYYNMNKWTDRTSVGLFLDIPGSELEVKYHIPVKTKSYAIFAQDAYQVTDRLTITAGLRYTWDKYDGTHAAYFIDNIHAAQEQYTGVFLPEVVGKAKFKYWSYRATVDYKITDDITAYVSTNLGYKSGLYGFNIIFDPNDRNLIEPEKLRSYEAGIKTSLLDRRLRVNATVYHYDYTNLQVVSISPQIGGGAPTTALKNAAASRIKGAELEIVAAPVDALTITANAGYLDAKYGSFPNGAVDPITGDLISYSDNRMPNAPKFSTTVSVSYSPSITNNINGLFYMDYAYLSKQYYNSAQDNAISSGKGYGLANMRIGLSDPDDRWEVALWGRNIFNKKYIYEVTDWSFEGEIGRYFGEMRTYGVSFMHRF